MKLICKFTIDIELIVEILILEKISFLIIYWQFYHFFITFFLFFAIFVKFFIYANILSSIDFHNNNDATVLNGDHFEIISFKVVSFKSVIL